MSSTNAASSAEIRYNALFADEDADFIIKAGDGTLFRICKIILKKSSDFFKDMLQLPQPPYTQEDIVFIDELPTVEVEESERTLEILFTLCYPVEPPNLDDISELASALKAALKYDMHVIVDDLRKRWPLVAAPEPLRAFAVACNCSLREEAEIAAKLSLQEPIWPLEPPLPVEYRYISADTLLRLESYHRKCATVASTRAADSTWCDSIFSAAICNHCQGEGWANLLGTRRLHWSDWFRGYTRWASKTLLLQPSSSVIMEEGLVHQSMNAFQCNGMTVHEFEAMQHAVRAFGDAVEKVISEVKLELDI
ncbi:hypothetical protein BDY19DRAFT_968474 [Irpex rosettiformis]|uniref:Uncharacterized protein n=1 Tax=Irpex rosettiformis TaxID=378272 RepID=A0ACB8TS26_9APHY|nr:hypothetical protein BDY19DRAFT_968474 [Irpex rosettiformis]